VASRPHLWRVHHSHHLQLLLIYFFSFAKHRCPALQSTDACPQTACVQWNVRRGFWSPLRCLSVALIAATTVAYESNNASYCLPLHVAVHLVSTVCVCVCVCLFVCQG
jgi:hypothetical protein